MKNLWFLLFLLPFLLNSCAAPTPASTFYHEHKRKEGVQNFKVPGWVIWIGTGIAHDIVMEEDVKVGLRLAKKVKKLRFMSTDNGNNPIHPAEVEAFVTKLKDHNYEDLLTVREGQTTVNFLVKDKNEKLKNLIVLVNEDEDFVYFDMKTKIRYEDLARLVNTFMDDLSIGEDEEPQPPREKKKDKKPQA